MTCFHLTHALRTRITRSRIMREAWRTARTAARRYGGNARAYLPEALRLAWAQREALLNRPEPPTTFAAPRALSRSCDAALQAIRWVRSQAAAVDYSRVGAAAAAAAALFC